LQFVNRHLRQLAQRITGVLPRSHPADEVTGELGETGAQKQQREYLRKLEKVTKDSMDGRTYRQMFTDRNRNSA
jgi:uncharacterized protein YPO0396